MLTVSLWKAVTVMTVSKYLVTETEAADFIKSGPFAYNEVQHLKGWQASALSQATLQDWSLLSFDVLSLQRSLWQEVWEHSQYIHTHCRCSSTVKQVYIISRYFALQANVLFQMILFLSSQSCNWHKWFGVGFVHKHGKAWNCCVHRLVRFILIVCARHSWMHSHMRTLDGQKPQRVRKSSLDVPDKLKAL